MTTGGVSVGDYDQVKQALTESGMNMGFWKIRMKPGKPLHLAIYKKRCGVRPAR